MTFELFSNNDSIDFFPEHHERYYLYLIISVTIGVLLCLIIITGRIIIQKQQDDAEDSSKDEPKFHKSNTGETTITKGFSGDNICDMEGGDIDLTTPMGMNNLPVKNEVIVMKLPKFFFIDVAEKKRALMINVSALSCLFLRLPLTYSCHRVYESLPFCSPLTEIII